VRSDNPAGSWQHRFRFDYGHKIGVEAQLESWMGINLSEPGKKKSRERERERREKIDFDLIVVGQGKFVLCFRVKGSMYNVYIFLYWLWSQGILY
jgi:hypothetical protein